MYCHRVFRTQFPCSVQCHHYPCLTDDNCTQTPPCMSVRSLNCSPIVKKNTLPNQINTYTHTDTTDFGGRMHPRSSALDICVNQKLNMMIFRCCIVNGKQFYRGLTKLTDADWTRQKDKFWPPNFFTSKHTHTLSLCMCVCVLKRNIQWEKKHHQHNTIELFNRFLFRIYKKIF